MNFTNIKTALVLAPHTDDGEFGCGGTICKLIESDVEVHYVAFSACQKSVPPEFPSDILVTEVKEATKILGIRSKNVSVLEYEVREFNFHRQEILDDLLKIRKKIQPDLIFTPSLKDVHQDHAVISQEAVRAFKFSSIFCYELPWNNFDFSNDCFVELSEIHLQTKVDALSEYKSQMHRSYASYDVLRSLAIVRGVQGGKKYAEVFEIKRLQL